MPKKVLKISQFVRRTFRKKKPKTKDAGELQKTEHPIKTEENLQPCCSKDLDINISQEHLNKTEENLQPCSKDIDINISQEHLNKTEEKLQPCSKDIDINISQEHLNKTEEKLQPCSKDIDINISQEHLNKTEEKLQPCSKDIDINISQEHLNKAEENLQPYTTKYKSKWFDCSFIRPRPRAKTRIGTANLRRINEADQSEDFNPRDPFVHIMLRHEIPILFADPWPSPAGVVEGWATFE